MFDCLKYNSSAQPDGSEVVVQRKGVVARRRKEAWNKARADGQEG